MAQIEAEVKASKERGRKGGRSTKSSGRGGRGRTPKPSQVITINTPPVQSRNTVDSAFLNVLSRESFVPVQGQEEEEVQKAEEVILRRKKKSTTDIAQVDTAVLNANPEADTFPKDKSDPDDLFLIADHDTDEKVVKALNLMILTAVVDSHNSEVDEQERVINRKAEQTCNDYMQRILK